MEAIALRVSHRVETMPNVHNKGAKYVDSLQRRMTAELGIAYRINVTLRSMINLQLLLSCQQ